MRPTQKNGHQASRIHSARPAPASFEFRVRVTGFQVSGVRFEVLDRKSTSTRAEVEQAQPYPGSLEHDTIGLSSS